MDLRLHFGYLYQYRLLKNAMKILKDCIVIGKNRFFFNIMIYMQYLNAMWKNNMDRSEFLVSKYYDTSAVYFDKSSSPVSLIYWHFTNISTLRWYSLCMVRTALTLQTWRAMKSLWSLAACCSTWELCSLISAGTRTHSAVFRSAKLDTFELYCFVFFLNVRKFWKLNPCFLFIMCFNCERISKNLSGSDSP